MKLKKVFAIMAAGIFLLLANPPCFAQDEGHERIGNYGYIDWINNTVVAKGIGAPPQKYYGKPQARPMAMRAATSDARRSLLEVIKGVYIDATTTVAKRITGDDAIATQVKGVLRSSTIDNIEYMSDGTVEATVSIPLTGELSTILLKAPTTPARPASGTSEAAGIENRMRRLEDRVRALEEKLAGLKQISYEQRELLHLLGQFVAARALYRSETPRLMDASQNDMSAAAINQRLTRQEKRLADLAGELKQMIGRIAALESGGGKTAVASAKPASPYTGLVIDARGLGFRPCLKPEIYGPSQLLYPGNYVNQSRAVRGGFVRYYRQLGRAQKSARAGSLPYTIKAVGVFENQRSLKLDAPAYEALKSLTQVDDGFLQNCGVVIVF